MHFSPGGQSSSHWLHSTPTPPQSLGLRKPGGTWSGGPLGPVLEEPESSAEVVSLEVGRAPVETSAPPEDVDAPGTIPVELVVPPLLALSAAQPTSAPTSRI
jgi:hypothetical protein